MSPKQVVGFSCLFNSEVDQLISKVIVSDMKKDSEHGGLRSVNGVFLNLVPPKILAAAAAAAAAATAAAAVAARPLKMA